MQQTIDGFSSRLCEFVAATAADDLPDTTRLAAKRSLLDAMGAIYAASGLSREVAPFVDLAEEADGSGPCAVIGSDARVAAPLAALANGAMAHALDYEDAFDAAPCHPNASAVPAAMALVQARAPVHGQELVAALAVGCEVSCRLALSVGQSLAHNGWYPPPILGAFGATAAAARLLRLSASEVRDAMSLTLCQVTAPGEIKHSKSSEVRGIREAFPAQAAVNAAVLAQSGVRGFEAPFEGEGGFYRLFADGQFDPSVVTTGLGHDFLIEQLSFKPWPCCRGTHSYIELALRFRQEPGFDIKNIESIVVEISSVQRMLVEPLRRKRAPETVIDAKFSIPFVVALALVRGSVGLGDFDDALLADARVLDLARQVTVREGPEGVTADAAAGRLTIGLEGGNQLSGHIEQALGSPDRPLSTAALRAKFVDCCGHAAVSISNGDAEAFADRILEIDACVDSGACLDGPPARA